MSHSISPGRPLLLADHVPGQRVRDAALVMAGAGLTGLAAQISFPVPGTPVPVTLQTFAVLLVGAALGWHRALAAMTLYVLAGIAGVPWFADRTSGIQSATFGYLLGFIAAATVVGMLAARGGDRTPLRTVATMLAGTLIIYALGVSVLMLNLGVGLASALALGVLPFLVGDLIKIVSAAGLLPAVWKRLT